MKDVKFTSGPGGFWTCFLNCTLFPTLWRGLICFFAPGRCSCSICSSLWEDCFSRGKILVHGWPECFLGRENGSVSDLGSLEPAAAMKTRHKKVICWQRVTKVFMAIQIKLMVATRTATRINKNAGFGGHFQLSPAFQVFLPVPPKKKTTKNRDNRHLVAAGIKFVIPEAATWWRGRVGRVIMICFRGKPCNGCKGHRYGTNMYKISGVKMPWNTSKFFYQKKGKRAWVAASAFVGLFIILHISCSLTKSKQKKHTKRNEIRLVPWSHLCL